MQQHCEQITSLDGWLFYTPCNDVEGDGPCKEYGALDSSIDMSIFDRVVQQFRKVEHEHDMPFTSLITLDTHDLSLWYYETKVESNIGQNKKSN